MPASTATVGQSGDPFSASVDARWLMAYAAGLGDRQACYFDTAGPDPVVGHPLFPVCVEWIGQIRPGGAAPIKGLDAAERAGGVHYALDVSLHRPVVAGDDITVTPTLIGLEAHRAGVVATTRFEAVDAAGRPVWVNDNVAMLRGAKLDGPDTVVGERRPPLPRWPGDGAIARRSAIPVAAGAAHTYTECARIWNPIHTDAAVAAAAGLPAIILHGTATFALAVSQVVAHEAGDDPRRVVRMAGRFGAMVLMPSTLDFVAAVPVDNGDGTTTVPFEMRTADGGAAVRHGAVVVRG